MTTTAPEVPSAPDREPTTGRAPRILKRRKRVGAKARSGILLGYLILIGLALIYIYPFLISIAGSFKTDAEATQSGLSLIPETITFAAYERLFTREPFALWAGNSMLVAVCVTIGRVLFDSMAGYALSRLRFRGRTIIFAAFIAVLSVPGVVLLIPRFLILSELGLYDTYGGMIIPLLSTAAGVFIMKQFFDSIPESIEEAAKIDGAGTFRRFWSVVLPMATPALVTIFILSFQGSWNELGHFIVARQSPELNTLTVGVAQLVSGQLGAGNQYPLQLAAAVLMSIPVVVLFFIFQRRIMNTTAGAEKG